jgi:hypothetical protein
VNRWFNAPLQCSRGPPTLVPKADCHTCHKKGAALNDADRFAAINGGNCRVDTETHTGQERPWLDRPVTSIALWKPKWLTAPQVFRPTMPSR